ncbi:MAG: hypothetical protein DSZ27_02845 [Thiomicrospira sp.]|nr:MAG: hypothetical protein DSZ27_02845 [Thiomicrospira sp.]
MGPLKNLHGWQPVRRVALFILFLAMVGRPFSTLAEATPTLKKIGQTTAYWAGVIPVYDAQLWASDEVTLENLLTDQTALNLKLCYHVPLSQKDFVEAAETGLPTPLSPLHSQAVNALHLSYESVSPNDCYRLSYDRTNGTQLWLNNQLKFENNTPGFKALYFGLWLGKTPLSDTVKNHLLKGL